MGKDTLSRDAYVRAQANATKGGTASATSQAEEKFKAGGGMDPNVDPKGPEHLGPIRRSLPRFEKEGKLWRLTCGAPMAEETLLDTTGSMGNNVNAAFKALPHSYAMLTEGKLSILGRYDVQIATAIFNDVEDNSRDGLPVLCRTQFEMGEKIALQMTQLIPGKGGYGNGKEDPQFGLFGAAYLTDAFINRYGLKYYHFTLSDEPLVEHIDLRWLRHIFGDQVLVSVKENGYDFTEKNLPDTAQVVKDLQKKAHAFFLQVPGNYDRAVARQWTGLYGDSHRILLPYGATEYLHGVKAVIIGLTEGVLDLQSAGCFLREHGIPVHATDQIVRAVANIPIGAQKLCPNFDRLPKKGDLFLAKTDLWPIDPSLVDESGDNDDEEGADWV